MAEITVVVHDAAGSVRELSVRAGRSLMHAAVAQGVDGIAADCGGSLSCATCHVIVAPDWVGRLPPPSADEQAMLEMTAVPRQPGSRLSCQLQMQPALQGLVVTLPERQY